MSSETEQEVLQLIDKIEKTAKEQVDSLEITVKETQQKRENRGRPKTLPNEGGGIDKGSRKQHLECAQGHSDTSDELPRQTAVREEASIRRRGTSSAKPTKECQTLHAQAWEIELKNRRMGWTVQTGSKENYDWFRNWNREPETNPHSREWIEKCWQRDRQQCKCYGWRQQCWADSAEDWKEHVQRCDDCRDWEEKECPIRSHSSFVKRGMLQEMSSRGYIQDRIILKDGQSTCCAEMTCIHDFFRHWRFDVPWWACVNGHCNLHFRQKKLNRVFPKVPRITILNAQKCPCLRKGCTCQYSEKHPYHFDLCGAQNCLNDTTCKPHRNWRKIWRIHSEMGSVKNSDGEAMIRDQLQSAEQIAKGLGKYNHEEYEIRMVQGDESAIKIRIQVNGKQGNALIDSGSTENFISRKFAKGLVKEIESQGNMTVTRFDGTQVQFPIRKAIVSYRIQGQEYTDEFRIIPMGDGTEIILGYPWMKRMNPEINWQQKTVKLPRAQNSREKKKHEGNSLPRPGALMQLTPETFCRQGDVSNETYQESTDERNERHIPEFEYVVPREEYEARQEEVRKNLPKYLWKYEEVFCPQA
jgi:Retroviral aspartyl protease